MDCKKSDSEGELTDHAGDITGVDALTLTVNQTLNITRAENCSVQVC